MQCVMLMRTRMVSPASMHLLSMGVKHFPRQTGHV